MATNNQNIIVVYEKDGSRCIKEGNVKKWYFPNQTQWHYKEVVDRVTGNFEAYVRKNVKRKDSSKKTKAQ